MSRITDRLQEDYEYLIEEGFEVLGVFLFGSQNYGTAIETSDIDTKAIVIPSVQQMIFGDTDIHLTIKRSLGELTVFDINSIHKSFKKQNVNFIEILFTEYRILNPKYEVLYTDLFEYREQIAHLNPFRAIHALYGNVCSKFHKFDHASISNSDRIAKYGYDNKALSDVFRYEDFMKRYIDGESYNHCLNARRAEYLKWLKLGDDNLHDFDTAFNLLTDSMQNIEKMFYEFINLHSDDEKDENAILLIDKVTENCCKAYIKERCYFEGWPTLSY